MVAVQILGVVVGLAAMHLTYLYYRRSDFTRQEFYLWTIIWAGFIFVAIFPRSVQPITGVLGLNRRMDLIMITAFIVLFIMVFNNYVVNKRQEKKLIKIIRSLAMKGLDDTKNK